MKKKYVLTTIIIALIILLVPLMIAWGTKHFTWFSFAPGDAPVWISFWGSFLGGLIGTIGIFVVSFNEQRTQNARIKTERKIAILNNERERAELLLNQVVQYRNKQSEIFNWINDLYTNIYLGYDGYNFRELKRDFSRDSKRQQLSNKINELDFEFNQLKTKIKTYNPAKKYNIKISDIPFLFLCKDYKEFREEFLKELDNQGTTMKRFVGYLKQTDDLYNVLINELAEKVETIKNELEK